MESLYLSDIPQSHTQQEQMVIFVRKAFVNHIIKKCEDLGYLWNIGKDINNNPETELPTKIIPEQELWLLHLDPQTGLMRHWHKSFNIKTWFTTPEGKELRIRDLWVCGA